MIKTITYEEIIKKLRNTIAENTGVIKDNVLNALSVRGTDLSKIITSTKVYSFSMCDVFILFELLKNEDGDNYVTPKDDKTMIVTAAYKLHLMVYGNGSDTCTQVLRATFKKPEIAQALRDEGIFVRNITSGETINEFINNTLLLRNDMELTIEVAYEHGSSKEPEYFKHRNVNEDDVTLTIEKV